MAYNCEQRIDELERLLIANQDCVDNVVDAYLQLEAEVAELKAKLDRYGNLLNDYSVREFKEEAYENEIFELKSKLAAEQWHDASELPTEEGHYLTFIAMKDGLNHFLIKYFWRLDLTLRDLDSHDENDYVRKWRLIIPPEGK
jgi:DNA repair exonuclease SbcCD ATPase subunit